MDLACTSLAEEPSAGHSAHARAHAHYETGDHNGGLVWMDGWVTGDGAGTDGLTHFAWHAALHELSLGDLDAVRRRYEAQLRPELGTGCRTLVDTGSLLFRWALTPGATDVPGPGPGDPGDGLPVAGAARAPHSSRCMPRSRSWRSGTWPDSVGSRRGRAPTAPSHAPRGGRATGSRLGGAWPAGGTRRRPTHYGAPRDPPLRGLGRPARGPRGGPDRGPGPRRPPRRGAARARPSAGPAALAAGPALAERAGSGPRPGLIWSPSTVMGDLVERGGSPARPRLSRPRS